MYILGISAFYHDSAAALLKDGVPVAAVQEERFTRIKHDENFPTNAIRYCLEQAGIEITEVKNIVFYDKPLTKFERLLESYIGYAPAGIKSFIHAMPIWLKDKIFLKRNIKEQVAKIGDISIDEVPELLFSEHHQSHAASAFFSSPFEKASILCLDGVGEWATTTIWKGNKSEMELDWEIDFPHSLGLLYSAFTYYTGFKVNSGEYKLMGLAPYGEPRFTDLIYQHLIDLKADGSFRLDMSYFNYAAGLTMTTSKFSKLFGGPPRESESTITQKEMDLAASIQKVTEEIVLRLANGIFQEHGNDYLCLAGGVALNCVSNGRLLREGPFKNIWVQPAAGDAGGALGAAQAVWHQFYKNEKESFSGERNDYKDLMQGSYLGPSFSNEQIEIFLNENEIQSLKLEDDGLFEKVADHLDEGKVIGWFQGRMEYGPRSLGNRSILGDPRNTEMQTTMNLKIKYRESFRPFAPAVLFEDVSDYFDFEGVGPYMLFVGQLREDQLTAIKLEEKKLFGIEKLKIPRSKLPAITHVDNSARIQTVHSETNPRFHKLISSFKKKTNCGVLVNTSFNVRGEPIVCTPQDAYRCFMRTEMDFLVLENYIINKKDQPVVAEDESWKQKFELD
ncbi:MAG: carbamoyltransferase [Halobacteriovoraceae bacterium]|nr:carbamoyltransferase [Halobacteriovoraceae bacterium]